MTDPEMILRLCAEAAPAPWYPKIYAQTLGIERDSLDPPLEQLRLAGLIRLTDWVQDHGQGYALTPEGSDLLHNPGALANLRAGRLPQPKQIDPTAELAAKRATTWDRGEAVRGALLYPSLPVVTLVILFANILVFLWGLALAVRDNVPVNTYIFSSNHHILAITGALSAQDIVQGAWWRLLSCCFVHIGLLHLGVNMYTLYAVGPLVEQMWGRWRFLALYLIAGLGGSCAQLIFRAFANDHPIQLAGASGALFGVMASMVVWIVLNRSYLPRPLTATWLRQLGTVFVVNTFISLMPGIGGAAHFGGAVVGALTAVLLNEQRFGEGIRRGLALVSLGVLPVLCVGALDHARGNDAEWQRYVRRLEGADWQGPAQPEENSRRDRARQEAVLRWQQRFQRSVRELEEKHLIPAQRVERDAQGIYAKTLPLLRQEPLQRPAQAVEQAIPALEQAQAHLTQAAAGLRKAGPYEQELLERLRRLRAEQLEARAKLCGLAGRCLQRQGQWTDQEQDELDMQARLVQQLDTEWRRLTRSNFQGRPVARP